MWTNRLQTLLKLRPRFPVLQGERLQVDFNSALTRDIDQSIAAYGLTMHPSSKETLNVDLAVEQHENMTRILKKIGLRIHNLPSDNFPDSVFIEDTAVAVDNKVLLTNPGAPSRRLEVQRVKSFFADQKDPTLEVEKLHLGTLDGGDVLFTGSEIIVGLSARTNMDGIESLARAFPMFPIDVIDLADLQENIADPVLHLKSFCSMCGKDAILVGGEVGRRFQYYLQTRNSHVEAHHRTLNQDSFQLPTYIVVHVPDVAAANCVFVNNHIIRRAGKEFPRSARVFETHPLLKSTSQHEIVYSELAKVDGALTCCSVLLNMDDTAAVAAASGN